MSEVHTFIFLQRTQVQLTGGCNNNTILHSRTLDTFEDDACFANDKTNDFSNTESSSNAPWSVNYGGRGDPPLLGYTEGTGICCTEELSKSLSVSWWVW